MSGNGKTRRPRPCARSARSRSGPYGRSSGRLVGAQVPHADATAQAALVDQFESLHTTWRKLEAVDHIWAVSDLHVEHESNFQFISSLHGFEKDALIVAGDVCSSLKLLRRTLQTLVRIFRHVFYCVGNHELWLGAEDASQDSFAKLVACYTVASEVGAHTAPVLLDNPAGLEIAILPLQSWYHCNFLKGGPAIDMPREHELFMMDSACAWPSAIARSSTSAELAAFFARLNTNAIANARTAKLGNAPVSEDEESYVEAQRVVISFSHFLPRPELHRTHPSKLGNRLEDVEGSLFLGDQVSQLAPDAHIFGHSHFNIDMTLDHIRFLQHPLVAGPKHLYRSPKVHAIH
ncbi:hypothetical protein AB1Y20_015161 [Prymnesium parvum]|uniref:Calcineurin-like phosphoesterase domain-containing protein n=1 Tax=Prymnesium parvum TaxID=97485 RepID=A0AB34K1Q6_PRYPA